MMHSMIMLIEANLYFDSIWKLGLGHSVKVLLSLAIVYIEILFSFITNELYLPAYC